MFKENRMAYKSPFHTQELQMQVSSNDPAVEGGIKYDGSNFRMNVNGTVYDIPTSATAGASKALANLVAVAINTSLISDTDSTDNLGSSAIYWKDTYSDRLLLNSTAIFSGATAGTAALTGALTVSLGSTLTGNVACGGDLSVGANADITGTLAVTSTTAVTGGVIGALFHTGTGITATTGAGAVAVTGVIHEVTTSGAGDALTLADGTAGQRLHVIYVAEGGGADTAVLTPTTLAGGANITFNALGDSADLVYSATGGWYVLGLGGTAAVA